MGVWRRTAEPLAGFGLLPGSASADIFGEREIFNIELRGPLSSVVADKRDRVEQSFTLSVNGQSYPVAVRVRGNSRVAACSFPPLRMNFRAEDVSGTSFEGQDKIERIAGRAASRPRTAC